MAHSGNRFKHVWDLFLYPFQMYCIVYLICVYLAVLSKIQNEIHGSLVFDTVPHKFINPLYPKFTSNKSSVHILCTNLYLAIAYVLIPNNVSNSAKVRNRYNQVPHLTQDINGKVTNSQLDTTNESQEVSPFPAGGHKAQINRRAQRHNKHKTEKHK